VVAAGFVVLAHGPGLAGWLGLSRRPDGTLAAGMAPLRGALFAGASGLVVVALGTLLAAIDTSGSAGTLTVSGNVVVGTGDLVLFYALLSVALFVVGRVRGAPRPGYAPPGEVPGEGRESRAAALRAGLLLAAAGFLVSAVGSVLVAVGFANAVKTLVITSDMFDAAGTALIFAGIMVGALGGVVTGPRGVVLVERINLKVGLVLGALGFLTQAVGNLLVGLSLVGSGSSGVFVAGDIVQGAGLWVSAIGLAVIASLGVEPRGRAVPAGAEPGVAAGSWGREPPATPPYPPRP
jgi:hypothetical protein